MSGFFPRFENIIDRIENFKINAAVLVIYLSSLIVLREIFEQLFFEKSFSPQQLVHHYFFYSFVLMTGILIISYVGKTHLARTGLIISVGFVLIVLPPLIDRVVSSRVTPYEYILPNEFLKNMRTFFLFTPKAGLGIRLEILAILLMSSFYVYIKTRSIKRSFFTLLSLYVLVGLSVTPRLYLPIPRMDNPLIWQHRHAIYFGYYFLFCVILGLILLFKINKNLPKVLTKELSSFRTLNFIFMVLIGIYFKNNLNFFHFPELLYVLISIILILMLWLSALLANNVYDLPIDRISNPTRPLVKGDVSPSTYLNLSLIFFLTALIVSVILGFIPFGLTLIIIFCSLAYSMPPLRMRKRLFSPLFVGFGSSLAFFIGYFYTTPLGDISVDQKAITLGIYIFVTLSLGSTTKDLKDYQGDLQNGVKTFFTLYGKKRGKQIVTILLALSLLVPLFLFHAVIDVILFLIISSMFSILYYVRETVVMAYLGYGIVIFYCFLRVVAVL